MNINLNCSKRTQKPSPIFKYRPHPTLILNLSKRIRYKSSLVVCWLFQNTVNKNNKPNQFLLMHFCISLASNILWICRNESQQFYIYQIVIYSLFIIKLIQNDSRIIHIALSKNNKIPRLCSKYNLFLQSIRSRQKY